MFQKKYSIWEELGSKVVLRIVKFMFSNITNFYGLSEIAGRLNTSKSNVHRALNKLKNLDLLRVKEYHGRLLYQINPGSDLSFPLWNLLVIERYMNVEQNLKDTIESLLREVNKEKINAIIILHDDIDYHGSGRENSTVDLCIVCGDKQERQRLEYSTKRFSPEYTFRLHFLDKREFENLNNPFGLDAVLNGIPLHGEEYIFDVRVRLREFPKSYLQYKIKKIINMLENVKGAKPVDRKYLKELSVIYLTQVEDAIPSKRMRKEKSGKIRRVSDIDKWINEVEERIARLSDFDNYHFS